MILSLFLAFLKIGAVSFGGGYGMIAFVQETVLSHGWMTQEEFLNIIAVSESTPGPLAVNMATFVGASQAGFAGALAATLGVVLPSFLLLLLIASLIGGLMKFAGVRAFLSGLRPAVVALVLATAFTMILSTAFGLSSLKEAPVFEATDLILFLLIGGLALFFRLWKKKALSPILLIVISGALGILLSAIG